MHGALAQAVPERVIAACNGAVHSATLHRAAAERRQLWVYLETIGGGIRRARHQGRARRRARAHDQHVEPAGRGAGARVSADPAALRAGGRLRRRRHAIAAAWACAASIARRQNAACGLDGSRLRSPPWGLAGGLPGGKGEFRFSEGTEPFRDGAVLLRRGDIVEIITPGAGGYGPPQERARSLVERDVREGRIDPELADKIYGRAP